MRFLTPAQVINGKLCDRELYPLALRGMDYTPVSEEQTTRDLFRFRHDGINLIRLNIDDSALSGPTVRFTIMRSTRFTGTACIFISFR